MLGDCENTIVNNAVRRTRHVVVGGTADDVSGGLEGDGRLRQFNTENKL